MKTVKQGKEEGVDLSALFGWGSSKCDTTIIEREMHHLKDMFKNDTYSTTEIKVPCTEKKHIALE
jgi:hypothetical protein